MKLHIVTVGKPKLTYAQAGWDLYYTRLSHLQDVRSTHLADKFAYDPSRFTTAAKNTTVVALDTSGQQYSSQQLADFLKKLELNGREVSFTIGGPEGLPKETIMSAQYIWSLGKLTLPHDLAMIVTLEALYCASTINANLPYHK